MIQVFLIFQGSGFTTRQLGTKRWLTKYDKQKLRKMYKCSGGGGGGDPRPKPGPGGDSKPHPSE